MSGIELWHVSKTYSGCVAPAVDDVSISIPEGDIVTLLGPSGCGKTTALRLIAGFERPDVGEIVLGERTVAASGAWIPPERRGVGMVFQEHALFPHLDVEHNVGFNLRKTERDERVSRALDLVGLAPLRDRMPHELSGGQQQRVALARALAHDPIVVLLDEPFSSLDADLRVQMRAEVHEILKAAGATAVLVSHDQRDALAISDVVAVMRDGRIEQVGTPRDVYQFPHTRFVAEFVGRSNILEGVVGADGASVDTTLGALPCRHTHGLAPGEPATVSVRPDSFELDDAGPLLGLVTSATYAGTSIDVVVETLGSDGMPTSLLVHAHPERILQVGDSIRFRVIPDFVAVIEDPAQ